MREELLKQFGFIEWATKDTKLNDFVCIMCVILEQKCKEENEDIFKMADTIRDMIRSINTALSTI